MSAFLSPQFVIGSIRIGSVENAACINMGNNWPSGFESHQKLTQGFGSVSGDGNAVAGIRSLLNDSDFLDMLNLSDSNVPEWLQKLIVSGPQGADADGGDPAGSGGFSGAQPPAPEIGPFPAG